MLGLLIQNMNVITEKQLEGIIGQKRTQEIPERFLPKVSRTFVQQNQKIYNGPPPKRKFQEDFIPYIVKI